MSARVRMSELSWVEVERRLARDAIVIVPVHKKAVNEHHV